MSTRDGLSASYVDLSKEIYSGWLAKVGNGDEQKAFETLTPDEKRVISTAIGVLENYKKEQEGGGPLTLRQEELQVLEVARGKRSTTAAPLEEGTLLGRIHQSFQSIHPLGKAEDLLRSKYLPSSDLKPLQERAHQLLDELEAPPSGFQKQGEAGAKILTMREQVILAPLREWAKSLPPQQKRVVLKAIERTEGRLLPAHYGVTHKSLDEAFALLQTEIHVARSQELKTDTKTLKRMGVTADGGNRSYKVGMERLEEGGASLAFQREELLQLVQKGLVEGLNPSEFAMRDRLIEGYQREVSNLIDLSESLERELEPSLANPEMDVAYSVVNETHANLIQHHQNLLVLLQGHWGDDAARFREDFRFAISETGNIELSLKRTIEEHAGLPPEMEKNESIARGHVEKAIIWGERAKDEGNGKAALQMAKYYFSYANVGGEEGEAWMQKALENVDVAIKLKVPGALDTKANMLAGRFYDLRNSGAGVEEVERYRDLALESGRKVGSSGLTPLFVNGVHQAGPLLVDALRKEMVGKKFSLEQVKALAVALLANVEGAEELLNKLLDKNPQNIDLQLVYQLVNTGLPSEANASEGFSHAVASECLAKAGLAISNALTSDLPEETLRRFGDSPVRRISAALAGGAPLELLPRREVVSKAAIMPGRASKSWFNWGNFLGVQRLLRSLFTVNIFRKQEADLLGPEEYDRIEEAQLFTDYSGMLVNGIRGSADNQENLFNVVRAYCAEKQLNPEDHIRQLGELLALTGDLRSQKIDALAGQLAFALFGASDREEIEATKILLRNKEIFVLESPPMVTL